MLESDLREEYMNKKKKEIESRQNIFVKNSCESLVMKELSYKIALVLVKKRKPL